MAEEPQAPAVDEEQPDTPEAAAPQEDGKPAEPQEGSQPAAPEHDYEQRYNDIRPEYDRVNQLVAAAKGLHGPELQAQAIQELGLEFQTEEAQDEEYTDPEDEIQRIKEYLAEQEQSQQQQTLQQQEEEYIDSTVSEIEKRENLNLSDEEFQLVVSAALTNREQDGRPDLEGAFKALKGVETAAHERYLESKKAPKAPAGTAGDRQFDTSTDEGRKEAMLAYMGEASPE